MINNIAFIALLLSAICLILVIAALYCTKELEHKVEKYYQSFDDRIDDCVGYAERIDRHLDRCREEHNKRINANYAETIDILNKHRMRMNQFEDAVPTLKLKKFKTVFRRAQSSYETEDLPF